MAVDVAVLGLKVDATGAITGLNAVESGMSRLTKTAAALGVTLGAGAIFAKMVRESIDSQYAVAQLEARVKSTGMAAGFSATQLATMASEMQGLTTYSDDAVMGAQSLLLTFTRIKGDVLPGATQAVADLATAMGGDLKGAALQVGKALNDPAQGLTALTRSGVSFSEAQKEVIKDLFATGQQAEAQKMILKELAVEFGGAAAAARDTLGGSLEGLKNSFGDLFEVSRESSSGVIAAINGISNALPGLGEKISATFGGMALYWVDLQAGIQNFNAAIYEFTAKTLDHVIGVGALIPGLSGNLGPLIAKSKELHGEAAILKDAYAAWKKEQYALILGTGQQTNAVRAQAAAVDELTAAYGRAKTALPKGPGMQAAGIGMPASDLTGSLVGSAAKMQDAITRNSKEESAKRAAFELEAWANADKERQQIYENFLRGMQETFAQTFKDIFTKGISSFRDLFAGMKDLFLNAISQMLASGAMQKITGAMKSLGTAPSGASGSQGASAGAGAASLGPVAAVVTAFFALGNSFIAAAAKAKEALIAQLRVVDAAVAAARAYASQNTVQDQIAEETRKFNAIMKDLGGDSNRSAKDRETSRLKAIDDATAAYERHIAAIKADAEQKARNATEDLAVRALAAQGRTAEAEAAAFANTQSREMAAALRDTSDAGRAYVTALGEVQVAERDAWERARERAAEEKKANEAEASRASQASSAVRLLAAQGREWEAQQAEMAERNRQEMESLLTSMGDTIDPLAIAALNAAQGAEAARAAWQHTQDVINQGSDWITQQGAVFGTDAQETFNQQSQNWGFAGMTPDEVRALFTTWTQGAELTPEQKALNNNIAAWLQGWNQLNPAAGDTASAAQSTASNIFAGADTVTSSFGARVSAEVGDRMLDNLVSVRVILRTYLPEIARNTRNLGGRLNTSLGLSLADAHALNGSAVLS